MGGEAAGAPAWAVALETSGFGEAMRQSWVLYPLANLSHLLGLTLLVGSMILMDLRLLGLGRRVSVEATVACLTPFAAAGVVIQAASGLAMFAADAAPLIVNEILQVKLALIALGLANAGLFRLLWRGERLTAWDWDAPLLGRLQAALSLVLWLAAATAGRLIAYF